MNANHCCAKLKRNNNRLLPVEPHTAVLLHPVSLAAHTHIVILIVEDWWMEADATRREGLNCHGEGAKGEDPVGP